MNQNITMEDLVVQGINCLRKEKRKRPTIKDLYFYCQEFDENNVIDFSEFETLIQHMIDSQLIHNRSKSDETKESLYINKDYVQNISKRNSSFISKISTEESANIYNSTTPLSFEQSLNKKDVYKTPTHVCSLPVEQLNDIVQKKVNACIEPFVNQISCLLKDYESLLAEKILAEDKNAELQLKLKEGVNNENMINQLKTEITFLKKEMQSKNEIIKIISNGRSDTKTPHSSKQNKLPMNDDKNINLKNRYEHLPTESTATTNKTVTIIGDSTIKQVKASKIRKNLGGKEKVFVKSFPGATVSQMHHYVKPSLEFEPDLVILHAGTNDLRSDKEPEHIAKNIIDLAKEVKTEFNDVILSSIIARADKYKEKANIVNKHLKKLCSQNSLEFMDNTNILEKHHLSHDGIHLNFKGTLTLSNNFCKAISC